MWPLTRDAAHTHSIATTGASIGCSLCSSSFVNFLDCCPVSQEMASVVLRVSPCVLFVHASEKEGTTMKTPNKLILEKSEVKRQNNRPWSNMEVTS